MLRGTVHLLFTDCYHEMLIPADGARPGQSLDTWSAIILISSGFGVVSQCLRHAPASGFQLPRHTTTPTATGFTDYCGGSTSTGNFMVRPSSIRSFRSRWLQLWGWRSPLFRSSGHGSCMPTSRTGCGEAGVFGSRRSLLGPGDWYQCLTHAAAVQLTPPAGGPAHLRFWPCVSRSRRHSRQSPCSGHWSA